MTSLKRFTVIAAILISPACFGQVDGKGLICDHDLTGKPWLKRLPPIAFFFDSGLVNMEKFTVENDEWKVKLFLLNRYETDTETIHWTRGSSPSFSHWTFYRKKGSLENRDSGFETLYTCQVMDDREHYEDTREQMKRSLQADYDKKREGNVL